MKVDNFVNATMCMKYFNGFLKYELFQYLQWIFYLLIMITRKFIKGNVNTKVEA